jgi:hypothetical protein
MAPADEAIRIDPLSGLAALLPGFCKVFLGLHEEALRMCRDLAARHRDDVVTQFFCGQLAATMGADDDALSILGHVSGPDLWGTLGALLCHAIEHRASDVVRIVRDDSIRQLALFDDQLGWTVAQALAAAGALDEAMWWLRHSAERGFVSARFVRDFDRMLAPLRSHPEMPGLLGYMSARAAAIAEGADPDNGAAAPP